MSQLADRISLLAESQTIMMSKLSREMIAAGKDVVNLSLGEPDFVTPASICEAAKIAIDEGYTHYTPIAGYLELRQAISKKLKEENNLTYSPEQIVVSTGAKQSVANVVLSLVNPGDKVIIPAPYWVSYIELVKLAGGIPVYIPTTVEDDFKFTPQQLREKAADAKLMIFSSPCNPTGTVFSHEELSAIADVVAEFPNLFVLSDEIYEYINFESKHCSIAEFPKVKDQVIIVNGMSKGFAMTGWRIGYAAAPLWIAKACDKIQGQFTSGTSSVSQRAALAAFQQSRDECFRMRDIFKTRRDLVLEHLSKIPGLIVNKPTGAFYVFPDVSSFFGKSFNNKKINSSTDLCMYLLEEAGVSLVMGEAFGAPECIRISYASSEENLLKALDRIEKALTALA